MLAPPTRNSPSNDATHPAYTKASRNLNVALPQAARLPGPQTEKWLKQRRPTVHLGPKLLVTNAVKTDRLGSFGSFRSAKEALNFKFVTINFGQVISRAQHCAVAGWDLV